MKTKIKNKFRNYTKAIPPLKETLLEKIKVQLDYKTVVVINRIASFEIWKALYPEAKIIHQ